MKKRIVWIDYMKAFLICLVVLGHSGTILYPILYLFHIPAFFFISGYLSNYSKQKNVDLKRIFPLLIAILCYNVLFIIINVAFAFFNGKGIMHANPGCSYYEVLVRPIIGIVWCYYPSNIHSNPVCA